MVLKKQTVWLLTMLSLMVVLSAYYLFNNKPMDMNEMANIEDEFAENLNDGLLTTSFSDADTNFFLSYRLERDTLRARMLDQYEEVISSDATAQVIADAKGRMDQLHTMSEAETTLESLIMAEGYEEAVVIAGEDKVDVVVKSGDALPKEKVLSIIHLVRDQLNVPGNQVYVSYR
jgi:stage III sporulation protein AH